jgi:hypothetical protein
MGNGGAHSNFNSNDLNKPMLIGVIDLLEQVEGMLVSVPTSRMVWLQPLDQCLMFRSQQLNHVFAPAFESDLLFVRAAANQENRELQPPVCCNCFGLAFQQSQLVDEVIESRSKIMGNLSNPDTPIIRQWRAAHSHAINMLSRLRIELRFDDTILGFLPKGVLDSSESLDFTFCTDYLEARAIQRIHDALQKHSFLKVNTL